jgi:hypothetical protein
LILKYSGTQFETKVTIELSHQVTDFVREISSNLDEPNY